MSILAEIVDSRLENSDETFPSENNVIIQIDLCTIMKDAWVGEEFCRDFCPVVFLRESQQKVKKAKAFSAFLGNDKGKLVDFWRHSVTPQWLECKTARRKTHYSWFDHYCSPFSEKVSCFQTCHSNRISHFPRHLGK